MDNRGKIIIVTLTCKCGCLMPGLGIYVLKNKLFNGNADAFTLCVKLWCVHTLNSRDAIAEIPCMRTEQGIFRNISSLSEVAKKEICTGIFGSFVVTKSSLPFITAEHIHRLQS